MAEAQMSQVPQVGRGTRWGLFIGVCNYDDPNWDQLPFCENDARALAQALLLDSDAVRILSDSASEPQDKPTRDNFEQAVLHLAETAGEHDTIIFGFFGHGWESGGVCYLIPKDGYLDRLTETAVELGWVLGVLNRSIARSRVLIFDACHASTIRVRGALRKRCVRRPMSPVFAQQLETDWQGFAVMSACAANQKSYDHDKASHGVYTYYLLEGLSGKADTNKDRVITVREAHDYAHEKVLRWVYKKGLGRGASKRKGEDSVCTDWDGKQEPMLKAAEGRPIALLELPSIPPRPKEDKKSTWMRSVVGGLGVLLLAALVWRVIESCTGPPPPLDMMALARSGKLNWIPFAYADDSGAISDYGWVNGRLQVGYVLRKNYVGLALQGVSVNTLRYGTLHFKAGNVEEGELPKELIVEVKTDAPQPLKFTYSTWGTVVTWDVRGMGTIREIAMLFVEGRIGPMKGQIYIETLVMGPVPREGR